MSSFPSWVMVPAQPPLPTASNFPFQSAIGSQTSILMSESDEGVSVAATRQKVGTWLKCGVAPPVPGRAKDPAGTTWARVIEVFGSAKDDRVSHEDADVRPCPRVVRAKRSTHNPPIAIFTARSSKVPTRRQQDKIHSKSKNPSKISLRLDRIREYDEFSASLVSRAQESNRCKARPKHHQRLMWRISNRDDRAHFPQPSGAHRRRGAPLWNLWRS